MTHKFVTVGLWMALGAAVLVSTACASKHPASASTSPARAASPGERPWPEQPEMPEDLSVHLMGAAEAAKAHRQWWCSRQRRWRSPKRRYSSRWSTSPPPGAEPRRLDRGRDRDAPPRAAQERARAAVLRATGRGAVGGLSAL